MLTLSERLIQADFEINDLRNHRDKLRLTHAFRELKDVMASAAIEGKTGVLQHGMNIVAMVPNFIPDDRVLSPMLALAFCNEFDPSPEMLACIQHPSLSLHERMVEAYVQNPPSRRTSDIASSIEKMCSAGHFQPLARLMDWVLASYREYSFSVANFEMGNIVKILNIVGLYAPWNTLLEVRQGGYNKGPGTLSGVLDVLAKHSDTFQALYEAQSLSDADALHAWASPQVIKGLMVTGNRRNTELLFHEYCMTEEDNELIEFMIQAGMHPDPVMVQKRLDICYDASVGCYPQSAMMMHLASGGKIPVEIDFERIGGKPIAKFLGKQCLIYGEQHTQLCVDLVDKFLENNKIDGLASYGLPRKILELRPDFAEECLAADMGL